MNSNYNILFHIDLFHEYYLNHTCNDFDIVPTPDCMQLAKRLNIQWRKKPNGLIAFMLANNLNEPFLNIPPEKTYRLYQGKSVFRFYLQLNNPTFLNYTNTALSSGSRKKYYFSNLSKNDGLYLTVPVPDYANGKVYVPGSLVKDPLNGAVYEALKKHTPKKKAQLQDALLWAPKGLLHSLKAIKEFAAGNHYIPGDLVKHPDGDEVYEAITKQTGTDVAELSDPARWLSRGFGQLQYATENDVVEYSNGNYTCKLPAPVSKAAITVFGFNYSAHEPAYNVPVLQYDTGFNAPTSQVPVSLGSLQPGRYEIQVNKEVRQVYIDPLLNESNAYAIIEIFNHLPGSDPCALLTDDETIRQVHYKVFFANRRVLWKYIRKDGRADRITDTADNGYEFDLQGDGFVSKQPIPLTEQALKTLKLEFNTKTSECTPYPIQQ